MIDWRRLTVMTFQPDVSSAPMPVKTMTNDHDELSPTAVDTTTGVPSAIARHVPLPRRRDAAGATNAADRTTDRPCRSPAR